MGVQTSLPPLPVSPISVAQRESANPAGQVPRAFRDHVASAGEQQVVAAARKEGWLRLSAKERWHDRPPLTRELQTRAAAIETRRGELTKPLTPASPPLWEARRPSRDGLSRSQIIANRARATRTATETDSQRNIANNPLAALVSSPPWGTHSHAATPSLSRASAREKLRVRVAHRVDVREEGHNAQLDHLGIGADVDAGTVTPDERGNAALLAAVQDYTFADHITLG